ncbi:MAG: tryptophan synthase subunit alpha [Candidatus Omnitrophica bacterium CG11_big_fil_rev_8_21_14_0_20_45_26]|uniref:Tryptophan synthase alpha chain n=1 Tax=Candidatus Abzuiibacterium crystallinum TaxID=1974748 RepID=A0A2H0LPM1_9BACT|nr:MAG: tryptophan synthase subunit alpha [Candidatus Omnitrophica bacterium CG11_big_fil_rev_8_21_14_0_20_45_26]PIW64326.1 MAG: tryptophan synthase subunit alpha [Candidatus Omnitrophica bacterium CG12_big_fil_rev_8_21_14_0_65_45_16]
MNALEKKIMQQHKQKKKIVCAFLTLGYPTLQATEKLIIEFDKLGVDVIEVGFPFSDPLADGPTIQASSDYALARHVKFQDAVRLGKRLRQKKCQIPLIFFSYFNPIHHHGVLPTARLLKQAGFDGVIIPDLPPDESKMYEKIFRKQKMSLVYLIAPTTTPLRSRWIAQKSKPFIYYVSLRGVTGARKQLDSRLAEQVRSLKRLTRKPVLVGFGISTEAHVKQVSRFADGIIVGSAIIKHLSKGQNRLKRTVLFMKRLLKAARTS